MGFTETYAYLAMAFSKRRPENAVGGPSFPPQKNGGIIRLLADPWRMPTARWAHRDIKPSTFC